MKRYLYIIIAFFIVSCTNGASDNRKKTDESFVNLGNWDKGCYVDGFGDSTGEEYLYISGEGKLTAYMVEFNDGDYYFAFKSLTHPYDDEGYFWLQYKTEDGQVSDWLKLPRSYGKGYAIKGEGATDIINRIKNGEKVKFKGFSTNSADCVITKGIYDTIFSFDFAHYKEAKSTVKW